MGYRDIIQRTEICYWLSKLSRQKAGLYKTGNMGPDDPLQFLRSDNNAHHSESKSSAPKACLSIKLHEGYPHMSPFSINKEGSSS